MLEQPWTITKSDSTKSSNIDPHSNIPVNLWFVGSVRLLLIQLFSLAFFHFGILINSSYTHTMSVIVITLTALLCIVLALRVYMDNRLMGFYSNISPSAQGLCLIVFMMLNAGFAANTIWQAYQLRSFHNIWSGVCLLIFLGLECLLPSKLQKAIHKVALFSLEAFDEAKTLKFNTLGQVLITTSIVLATLGLLFGISQAFNMLISSFLSFFLA